MEKSHQNKKSSEQKTVRTKDRQTKNRKASGTASKEPVIRAKDSPPTTRTHFPSYESVLNMANPLARDIHRFLISVATYETTYEFFIILTNFKGEHDTEN
jgi:hypothetical protein